MKRKAEVTKNSHIKPDAAASKVKPQRKKSRGKARLNRIRARKRRTFIIVVLLVDGGMRSQY